MDDDRWIYPFSEVFRSGRIHQVGKHQKSYGRYRYILPYLSSTMAKRFARLGLETVCGMCVPFLTVRIWHLIFHSFFRSFFIKRIYDVRTILLASWFMHHAAFHGSWSLTEKGGPKTARIDINDFYVCVNKRDLYSSSMICFKGSSHFLCRYRINNCSRSDPLTQFYSQNERIIHCNNNSFMSLPSLSRYEEQSTPWIARSRFSGPFGWKPRKPSLSPDNVTQALGGSQIGNQTDAALSRLPSLTQTWCSR